MQQEIVNFGGIFKFTTAQPQRHKDTKVLE
jgi:hypothetical protein